MATEINKGLYLGDQYTHTACPPVVGSSSQVYGQIKAKLYARNWPKTFD